jgi:MFS family permease
MIGCDLIRVAAIGSIPAALALGAPLAIVYGLVLVSAFCGAVFNPARLAIVPDLVPKSQLGSSNSVVYASDRTVEIVGTLLAGLLVAALGAQAFYVDAVTFALSALLLLRISAIDPPARPISWGSIVGDAVDGVRTIRRTPVLWSNTVYSLVAQLSLPVQNGLTPVLIFREYRLGPEQLGMAEAAIALGAVAAGVVVGRWMERLGKGTLITAGFSAFGTVLVLIGLAPGFPVALVLFAALGAANVVFYVPNVTLSQEVTPPGYRARVFGARAAMLNLTWLPVILFSGAVAESVSVPALLLAAGAFTGVVGAVGVFVPSIRNVR